MRKLKHLVGQLAAIRWLEGRITDFRYGRWKRVHPEESFAQFYAERVASKIAAGRHHKTLGPRAWRPGHGSGVKLDQTSFAERGRKNWSQILSFGVTPRMRCVDYGCGSLRVGQHAIRYLDPGNYWGVDVAEVFIAEGLKLIDPELVEDRKPRFGTIDEGLLTRLRSWGPDFVFSNAVLVHVPPAELVLFFRRIDAIMKPGSEAVIIYIASDRTQRVKSMNWVYSEASLMEAAERAGVMFNMTFEDVREGQMLVDGRPRRALVLRTASATDANASLV